MALRGMETFTQRDQKNAAAGAPNLDFRQNNEPICCSRFLDPAHCCDTASLRLE
jgi:hypothetical protein